MQTASSPKNTSNTYSEPWIWISISAMWSYCLGFVRIFSQKLQGTGSSEAHFQSSVYRKNTKTRRGKRQVTLTESFRLPVFPLFVVFLLLAFYHLTRSHGSRDLGECANVGESFFVPDDNGRSVQAAHD